MIKMILGFIALFAIIYVFIDTFIRATGREKIQWTKLLGYTMLCTAVTVGIVTAIVTLF